MDKIGALFFGITPATDTEGEGAGPGGLMGLLGGAGGGGLFGECLVIEFPVYFPVLARAILYILLVVRNTIYSYIVRMHMQILC